MAISNAGTAMLIKMMGGSSEEEEAKRRALTEQSRVGMKKGGAVKSASSRADGCACRGKTKGKIY